jgi:hypothetical protein
MRRQPSWFPSIRATARPVQLEVAEPAVAAYDCVQETAWLVEEGGSAEQVISVSCDVFSVICRTCHDAVSV